MHDNPKGEPAAPGTEAQLRLHGVLVRVLDTGVLLVGESGIGKSECALDLVTKGHTLVADDVVDVFLEDQRPAGRAPELTFELLEIRGLGIINVRELFGENAVTASSTIDLCIELRTADDHVDRLKASTSELVVFERRIPKFVLPVQTGRNLSTLILTAVKLFRNEQTGKAADGLIARQAELVKS